MAGLTDGCRALATPVVSGNVSFYNETGELKVAPSPTVGMVGHLERAEQARGMGWRMAGDAVALLGETRGRISGSEYQTWLAGEASGTGPGVDLEAESALVDLLVATARRGLLRSAHDVSQGGLLVALAEGCLASPAGLGVEVSALPGFGSVTRADALLFGEEGARAVVSFDPVDSEELAALAAEHGVPFAVLGTVVPGALKVLDLVDLRVDEMRRSWCPGDGVADFDWPDDGEGAA